MLPYYIDEDVRITETLAIMKHISAKHQPSKMLGKTDVDQKSVEMLAEVLSKLLTD